MKALVFALGLAISVSAQAENFYRCMVITQPKNANWTYELGMYLSDARTSRQVVANTDLNLMVSPLNGEITGTVNGQPNFILSGDVRNGAKFESAHATGTISCTRVGMPVALYSTQFGEIYKAKDAQSFPRLLDIKQLEKSCYIAKDVNAVAAEVRSALANESMTLKLAGDTVVATRLEKTCLESVGSYDDYECIRWSEPAPRSYQLKNCYQSPEDPR